MQWKKENVLILLSLLVLAFFLINMFSGGALEQFSIFALGIMPYISASIILQLLTVVIHQLAALKLLVESGAHPELRDRWGHTPMERAALSRRPEPRTAASSPDRRRPHRPAT